MKEITTTTVTTEVIRRAPRKKTIVGSEHIVSDGRVYIAEKYAPITGKTKGEGHGITRLDINEAQALLKKGLTNTMGDSQGSRKECLATSLLHITGIRDGLCDMAMHPELSMLDKDDCERLMIIAVQLNEFIPILRDIMTARVSKFASNQFQAL